MTDEGLLVLIGLGIGFVIIVGYIYFKSKVAYLEGLNEGNRIGK